MSTAVQLVLLRAPKPAETARFYSERLGFTETNAHAEEVALDGHGIQLVITKGDGDRLTKAPPRDRAAFEIAVSMNRMESLWLSALDRDPMSSAPSLDPSGVFVYVTLDPAGNAVSVVTQLPTFEDDEPRERITTRLPRPG